MGNDARLDIRLPKKLKEKLDAKCEREMMVRNKFLIKIIKEAVEKDEE